MKTHLVGGALFCLAGLAGAAPDLLGTSVVSQVKIADPVLATNTINTGHTTNFGGGGIQNIGDFDGDDIDDVVVGASQSYNDSGSLQLLTLKADGSLKASYSYSTREAGFTGKINHFQYERFGMGVAVLSRFTSGSNCANLAVSSYYTGSIFGLSLCKDNAAPLGRPILTVQSKIDSSSAPLKGVTQAKAFVSLSVVDTIGDKTILALGTPEESAKSGHDLYAGGVIFLSVDPSNWAWEYNGKLPSSQAASDPLYNSVYQFSQFGQAVVPLRSAAGVKAIAVLSPGDTTTSSAMVGQIHVITMNAKYSALVSHAILSGSANVNVTGAPTSIAAADINHDGISDLVIGYSDAKGSGGESRVGGYSTTLLNSAWEAGDTKFFTKNTNGISNAATDIATNGGLGASLLATDFDHDGQVDVIAGAPGVDYAYGLAKVPGSVMVFRMKSAPWIRKAPDDFDLSNGQLVTKVIADYITGNQLSCGYTPPPAGSIPITCTFDGAALSCKDGKQNGSTSVRIICTDNGNFPATPNYSDTLDFKVNVTLANELPSRKLAMPVVTLREDQPDTTVLSFSTYFTDKETSALTYTLAKMGAGVDSLLAKFSVDPATSNLKLTAIPLRFGRCSLSVTVTDGAGGVITDTLRITVNHVNHQPTGNDDTLAATEATATYIRVLLNDVDPDRDILSLAVGSRSAHGTTLAKGDTLFYTPDSFYQGADSVKYTLKDPTTGSATAMLRINVTKASGLTRVVRKLPDDVTVLESAPKFEISYDSLFYNGLFGFNVPVYNPPSSGCGPIADVSLDTVRKVLIIAPKTFKYGECKIIIRQAATYLSDTVSGSTMLHITSVVSPYRFGFDTAVEATMSNSTNLVYQMRDSLDNDQDTIEYYLLSPAPSWLTVDHSRILTSKTTSDTIVSIATRKKVKAGQQVQAASDTMTLIVYAAASSSLRGRKLGGLRMQYASSTRSLTIVGGQLPFVVDLVRPDGQCLGIMSGGMGESTSAIVPASPGIIYLRILEGSSRRTYPILLNP